MQRVDFQTNEDCNYVSPSSSTEVALAEILQAILNLHRVSVKTYFFDVGGDFLGTVRYKYKIDKKLSIELPLPTVFTHPTIEGLAKLIDEEFKIEEF